MALDLNCLFRKAADGDLVADGAFPADPGLDAGGPDLYPRTLQVHVPEMVAATTLDITLETSDDGATWVAHATMPTISAVGEYFLTTKVNHRYRRLNFNVGGAADFGIVLAGYVPAGRYKKW